MLRERGVIGLQFVGAAGSGRTTLLAATLFHLGRRVLAGVIVGDLTSSHRYDRLAEHCEQLIKIDAARLDAERVRDALAHLDLDRLEWVIAEGTVGPDDPDPAFDLGQHITIAVFNVAGGDDKPAASAPLVARADAVVLTQLDLLPHVPFSLERFHEDVRRINPRVEIFGLSALADTGMTEWINWLLRYRVGKSCPQESVASPEAAGHTVRARGAGEPESGDELHGEWYFG
jgi:hydrogenase nickel incorporation protein HypB